MPLTDQDIRALVHLAVACRPPRAPRWDEAGIFAAIAKVRQLNLADVALAVIRAADDAGAKTPGVIANTSAPNWAERSTQRTRPPEPWNRAEFCSICSEPEARCRARWSDDHAFEPAHARDTRLATDPRRNRTEGARG